MQPALASDVARKNWQAYMRGVSAGHNDYIQLAKKCDRFYIGGGKQWDDAARAKLEGDGRPALEINLILSTINALSGQQRSQRADIVFKPKRNADQETADALTKLASHVQDENKYPYLESRMFDDGVIQERGYLDIRMDFSDNIMGELKMTVKDPITVVIDADAKEYDPRTWREVTTAEWMSNDDIASLYGQEKADEVKLSVANNGAAFGSESVRMEESRFGQTSFDVFIPTDDVKQVRSTRVIERQHRRLARTKFFVDNVHGDMRQVPDGWDDAKIAKVALAAGLSIIEKMAVRIRWTVSADAVVLHDDWSPYDRLTIIPYFPYFRRGKPFGVVSNLISSQEQLNKLESQELHIINTTANSGWTVEAGSLMNMTEDELESRGAETGLVLVYRKDRQAPQKIKPNDVPSGIDRASMKSANNIRTISGIGEGMLDIAAPNVSGVALSRKNNNSLVQLQVPFDNLNFTRQLIAEHMLELFQQYYTETRVLQVTDYTDPQHPREEVTINGVTPEGRIVNDLTIGEYAVKVSSAPARDSFEESQFAEALSLRQADVAIPDDVVVEFSHLSDKHAVAERIRQRNGEGQKTPQELQMMQMQQQMAMRHEQLAISELESKVALNQATARLTLMKAGATEQEAQASAEQFGAEMRLQIAQMKQDWEIHVTNLQSKMDLAGVHTKSKMDNTVYSSVAKQTQEVMKAGFNRGDRSAPK